jgi:hypothetical protein
MRKEPHQEEVGEELVEVEVGKEPHLEEVEVGEGPL